ncbi:MAG: hypothetical protein N2038_06470 [Geminicoccaceae bacterium]|nr:hypothetical protein [Geminicoccaceae bacterium]MCX7629878.1 hypothetical protein [Geminicoccaceae bacterium]MDW8124089.1 hypothetical protein [Geminicoccaceae bacterium]
MRYLAAGGGLLLAACAASPERPDGGALAAIALPVFVAFKAAGCAVTIAFAAPGAAVVQLTDRPDRERLVADLERGVAHNCGGRWTPGDS